MREHTMPNRIIKTDWLDYVPFDLDIHSWDIRIDTDYGCLIFHVRFTGDFTESRYDISAATSLLNLLDRPVKNTVRTMNHCIARSLHEFAKSHPYS